MQAKSRRPRRRTQNTCTCADSAEIVCRQDSAKTDGKSEPSTPRNGIQAMSGRPTSAIVAGVRTSRDVTEIIRGSVSKTHTLPSTVVAVREYAFCDFGRTPTPVSVRFSNNVERLGSHCFAYSGIRQLALPPSVRHVSAFAFYECKRLALADLSAARGLAVLGKDAFCQCGQLRCVRLNEGLETICRRCFAQTGLEEVAVPSSVRRIGRLAFGMNGSLRQVRFLGATEGERKSERSG